MDVISRLRQVPFMSHLREVQLQALAQICRAQRFIAGEDIIHQGDLTNRFFIVDEGQVNFRRTDSEGFEHPAGVAVPGAFFGEKMLTTQEPAPCTAEALGQATLYVIDREAFDGLLRTRPDILRFMPQIAQERRKLTQGLNWLTPGETIVLATHRHGYTLFLVLLLPFITLALLVGAFIAGSNWGLLPDSDLPTWIGIALAVAIIGWGAFAATDWADDDFIVTNKRVAHAERILFFGGSRDEIPIPKIQSITDSTPNTLQALLGVSSLEIHSGGREEARVVFDKVANAKKIKTLILEQQGHLRAREQAVERERFRRHIGRELRHYVLKQSAVDPEPAASPSGMRVVWRPWTGVWHKVFGMEFHRGSTITWRKHWVVLLRQGGRWIAVLAALVVIAISYLVLPGSQYVPNVVFFAILGFFLLIALIGLVYQWEDWRNDIYEVDDRQITDIERLPLGLSERSTVALLANIQDVRSDRPHLINTILNFGNVVVQVAGGGAPLTFFNVAEPQEITAEIFRRMEAFRVKRLERETSVQSREIVDALVAYHRLLMQERHGTEQAVDSLAPTLAAAQTEAPNAPSNLPASSSTALGAGATRATTPPQLAAPPRAGEPAEFPPPEEIEELTESSGRV